MTNNSVRDQNKEKSMCNISNGAFLYKCSNALELLEANSSGNFQPHWWNTCCNKVVRWSSLTCLYHLSSGEEMDHVLFLCVWNGCLCSSRGRIGYRSSALELPVISPTHFHEADASWPRASTESVQFILNWHTNKLKASVPLMENKSKRHRFEAVKLQYNS